MTSSKRIQLTARRLALLVAGSGIAAVAAIAVAGQAEARHSSTTTVFTGQLLRENRTDDELRNTVDDIILTSDLAEVHDLVEERTGLAIDTDYTVVTERAVDSGETLEVTATAASPEAAETVSLQFGLASFELVLGQDRARAATASSANAEEIARLEVRLDELELEAGGVSPVEVHDQAQGLLAGLINARAQGTPEAPAEAALRGRIAETSTMRREYLRLEAQLAALQDTELDHLSALADADAAFAALDSGIMVTSDATPVSSAPVLIQAILVAVAATLALGFGAFALIDRRRQPSPGDTDLATDAEQPDGAQATERLEAADKTESDATDPSSSETETDTDVPDVPEKAEESKAINGSDAKGSDARKATVDPEKADVPTKRSDSAGRVQAKRPVPSTKASGTSTGPAARNSQSPWRTAAPATNGNGARANGAGAHSKTTNRPNSSNRSDKGSKQQPRSTKPSAGATKPADPEKNDA